MWKSQWFFKSFRYIRFVLVREVKTERQIVWLNYIHSCRLSSVTNMTYLLIRNSFWSWLYIEILFWLLVNGIRRRSWNIPVGTKFWLVGSCVWFSDYFSTLEVLWPFYREQKIEILDVCWASVALPRDFPIYLLKLAVILKLFFPVKF